MKIKNKGRFIISMSVIFLVILFFVSMITNKVLSHQETKYEKILVSNGDTLWSIASEIEGDINRNIYEIKQVNHLEKSNLYIGQELLIPSN